MKAKMVFDSPSRYAGAINKKMDGSNIKVYVFSEDSHAKQIISPVIVPYMVTHCTEGTPVCKLLSITQTATIASCFPIAPGRRACPAHSIMNHILFSLIKVSKYIQLKTTGKGTLC